MGSSIRIWRNTQQISGRIRPMDSIGDDFVDMLSSAQHMSWHIDSIKKPLETFAEYSYSQSDSVDNLPNE